ncbi:MAG: YihY/virulence factor BrkB family protein [Actinomycetota bacterium]|nr:YihY/virulence factor BrkB family protein [Actinomycetota bacterium]
MTPLERLLALPGAQRAVALVDRLRAIALVHVVELTVRRFLADGMVDRGASLAYYGLLSLLPTLMIGASVVSVLGGDSTAIDFGGYVRDEGASATLAKTAESIVKTAVDSAPTQAGTIGVIGLATLIYGASRAFAAAGRALDVIWRRRQKGLTITRRIAGIGWTVVLLVLGLIAGVLTFVGRGLAEDLLELVGLEDVSAPMWTILRWPLAAVAMMLSMRLVMWAAPSPPRGRFRIVTPGAVTAAALWLTASAGYGFYVGELSSYNATYGAFAAVVILLLWIWLTSMAFLLGCELDAVLVERREAQVGGDGVATGVSAEPAAASPHRAGAPEPPPREPGEQPPARTHAEGR